MEDPFSLLFAFAISSVVTIIPAVDTVLAGFWFSKAA